MRTFFEHTADIGLRVRAPTLEALFAEAAEGLFALIVENLEDVRPVAEVDIRLAADDLPDLLQDWLSELLFRFETEGLVCSRFDVQVDGTALSARVHGERLDPARHRLGPEVKAVTYHHLAVERDAAGFTAEVVFDI